MKKNTRVSKDKILLEFIPGLFIWAILIVGAYFAFSSPNTEITEKSMPKKSDEPKTKVVPNKPKERKKEPKKVRQNSPPKKTLGIPPKKVKAEVSTKLFYPKKGAKVIGKKIDFRWKSKLKDFSYFKVILISPDDQERTLVTTRKQSFTWIFDEAQKSSKYSWKVLTISKRKGKTETTSSKVSHFFYQITKQKKPSPKKTVQKAKKTRSAPIGAKEKKYSPPRKQDPKNFQNEKLDGKAVYVSDKK